MKLKKVLTLIAITSIILICNSIEVYGWVQRTYEACNIINVCIAGTLKLIAFIVSISYITVAIRYIRNSKQESKQKLKNLLTWLIITAIQVMFLLLGATGVTEVGMETYIYSTGEREGTYQLSAFIANAVRIIAFVSMIFYIIKSIAYFVTSEEENKQKITKLVKWQVITAIIVAVLLKLATI